MSKIKVVGIYDGMDVMATIDEIVGCMNDAHACGYWYVQYSYLCAYVGCSRAGEFHAIVSMLCHAGILAGVRTSSKGGVAGSVKVAFALGGHVHQVGDEIEEERVLS